MQKKAAVVGILMVLLFSLLALFFTGLEGVLAEDVERIFHTTSEGYKFYMRQATAAQFPTGVYNRVLKMVDCDFWIAETQVTYELWYEVKVWAEQSGYNFANVGREGSHGGTRTTSAKNEPVTMVNWYDCIVWCNALSQYMGHTPVYYIDGQVVKDALDIDHAVVIAEDADGFRLPTSDEWELAARYKGRDGSHSVIEVPEGSGQYWAPGNYASGAKDDYSNEEATKAVAWYSENSRRNTHDVGQKPEEGNGLGLFDMSGNVWEWCFTRDGDRWIQRGGSWNNSSRALQVGFIFKEFPNMMDNTSGFRLVRRP